MQKIIPVVAAIIVKDNKILAARRKVGLHLAGYWEFPGGKVEHSEPDEAALLRELKEEFGISANVDYLVGVNTHQYGEKTIKLSAYRVNHLSGNFQLRDHDKIEWLKPDQLYTLNWAPADIPLIDDFLRIFSIGEYYDENANEYAQETNSLDVTHNLEKFVNKLGPKGHILDLGCGSGRDAKNFLEKGYQVTAIDGSTTLAAIAEKRIGQKVHVTLFQHLNLPPTFDGVWACASLLHCPPKDLERTILNIYNSLLPNGVMYVSVKYGNSLSTDNKSRLFTYFTEQSFKETLTKNGLFEIEECWSETKMLRDSDQTWLNALCRKSGRHQ